MHENNQEYRASKKPRELLCSGNTDYIVGKKVGRTGKGRQALVKSLKYHSKMFRFYEAIKGHERFLGS